MIPCSAVVFSLFLVAEARSEQCGPPTVSVSCRGTHDRRLRWSRQFSLIRVSKFPFTSPFARIARQQHVSWAVSQRREVGWFLTESPRNRPRRPRAGGAGFSPAFVFPPFSMHSSVNSQRRRRQMHVQHRVTVPKRNRERRSGGIAPYPARTTYVITDRPALGCVPRSTPPFTSYGIALNVSGSDCGASRKFCSGIFAGAVFVTRHLNASLRHLPTAVSERNAF